MLLWSVLFAESRAIYVLLGLDLIVRLLTLQNLKGDFLVGVLMQAKIKQNTLSH